MHMERYISIKKLTGSDCQKSDIVFLATPSGVHRN